MSWQDRDYSDETYGEPVGTSSGLRRPPAATLTLMILHGAALLLMLMLRSSQDGPALLQAIALRGDGAHPLGILLHPLATSSLLTAAFSILAIWSLGGRLEPLCGARWLVLTYVVANLVAGTAYFGFAQGLPQLATTPLDYPVGALAAYCLTAWRRFRREQVLVFGHLTSLAKMYAICAAVVAGLALIAAREGAVAWLLAALAGAAGSVALERMSPWLREVVRSRPRPQRSTTPRLRPVARRPQDSRTSVSLANAIPPIPDVDDILAKISREGLHALTAEERERLEAARVARLRHPNR